MDENLDEEIRNLTNEENNDEENKKEENKQKNNKVSKNKKKIVKKKARKEKNKKGKRTGKKVIYKEKSHPILIFFVSFIIIILILIIAALAGYIYYDKYYTKESNGNNVKEENTKEETAESEENKKIDVSGSYSTTISGTCDSECETQNIIYELLLENDGTYKYAVYKEGDQIEDYVEGTYEVLEDSIITTVKFYSKNDQKEDEFNMPSIVVLDNSVILKLEEDIILNNTKNLKYIK